ncbi:sensor histidine kinase [Demequina gelatinilytica]|uniref:sensor histidine kinase n=1 Tax=Demequina gelatinilytica TaxID=1638980 RepID=UPI0007866F77|nr:HAMP domain-containing sensor histidine kinase [Demequina gelatinilytica]
MTRRRSLESTLVGRVVAVLAIGLVAVAGLVVGALSLHLRAAAEETLAAAVATVERADAAGTTLSEARVSRVLPTGGAVAFVTADGSVRAIAPEALDVRALPVEAEPGEGLRFTLGDRVYVAETIATEGLTLRTEDGPEEPVARVLVALDVTSDRATVRRVSFIAVAVALLGAAALAVVGRAVVRRSLAPVEEVAAAAARIARTGEAEPMPDGGPYDETMALAASVDDALRRRTEAERAVRDFVADASHELRTPVAKIQGWAEVALSAAPDNPRGRHATERVIGAAEELAAIVDELGLLARLDAAPRTSRERIDVGALAREVVADAGVVAPAAALTCHVGDGVPAVVGDRAALTRAVRNLVGNALQHGGERIDVRVEAVDGGAAVTVADDGPGIPRELRTRVFDRFFSTAPGNPRHSGLGLAIVGAAARTHGGRAEVLDSDRGATVLLWLPAAIGAPTPPAS